MGGPQPTRYLELVLCRDVYHCTPVQLREIPMPIILEHLTCLAMEARAKRANSKFRKRGGK